MGCAEPSDEYHGPVAATFQYDASGRRTRKTINGVTTDFVHDGINPVTESNASGMGFLLAGLGVDDFLLRVGPGSTSMFLSDALGSLVATTDAAGGVQSELTYEPFGNTEMSAAAPAYRFTGREHDEPLYLYYYRARYYHTDLQRFISEDLIGFAGGDINLYGYARNNPLRFIDSLGLEITIRYYPFGADSFSHVSIQVNNGAIYGFYPEHLGGGVAEYLQKAVGVVPGTIATETRQDVSETVTINTTAYQDETIEAIIANELGRQNRGARFPFNGLGIPILGGRNCATWVTGNLSAAGIPAASFGVPALIIPTIRAAQDPIDIPW